MPDAREEEYVLDSDSSDDENYENDLTDECSNDPQSSDVDNNDIDCSNDKR